MLLVTERVHSLIFPLSILISFESFPSAEIQTPSVLYEVLFSYAYNALGSSGYLSPFVRVALDGTVINSSRKGHLWNSGWDAEMRIAIPIQIVGASDDIANMKVASWGSARTIKTQISTYNAGNYRFASHYNYYGPGSSVQYVVPPFIKITAYS